MRNHYVISSSLLSSNPLYQDLYKKYNILKEAMEILFPDEPKIHMDSEVSSDTDVPQS